LRTSATSAAAATAMAPIHRPVLRFGAGLACGVVEGACAPARPARARERGGGSVGDISGARLSVGAVGSDRSEETMGRSEPSKRPPRSASTSPLSGATSIFAGRVGALGRSAL
jgi:hypothetical protein